MGQSGGIRNADRRTVRKRADRLCLTRDDLSMAITSQLTRIHRLKP
jgi:hypothetical protein